MSKEEIKSEQKIIENNNIDTNEEKILLSNSEKEINNFDKDSQKGNLIEESTKNNELNLNKNDENKNHKTQLNLYKK